MRKKMRWKIRHRGKKEEAVRKKRKEDKMTKRGGVMRASPHSWDFKKTATLHKRTCS
jgi:hypothetical protein